MSTIDETVRFVPTTRDGAMQILRADRDHVSVQLVAEVGAGDVLAHSRLLCGAVTEERARGTRHVQVAIDGSIPSCVVYLQALRARIGTEVRSVTTRRAGSSVMVDAHLLPPGPQHRMRPATGGRRADPVSGSDQPTPVVGASV